MDGSPQFSDYERQRLIWDRFPSLWSTRDGRARRSMSGCEAGEPGEPVRAVIDSLMDLYTPTPDDRGWHRHWIVGPGGMYERKRLVERHDKNGLAVNRSADLARRAPWLHHLAGHADGQFHVGFCGELRRSIMIDVDVLVEGHRMRLPALSPESLADIIGPWSEGIRAASDACGTDIRWLPMLSGGRGLWVQLWFDRWGTVPDCETVVDGIIGGLVSIGARIHVEGTARWLTLGDIRWDVEPRSLTAGAVNIPLCRHRSERGMVSHHLDDRMAPDPLRFVGFGRIPSSPGALSVSLVHGGMTDWEPEGPGGTARVGTAGAAAAPSVPPQADGTPQGDLTPHPVSHGLERADSLPATLLTRSTDRCRPVRSSKRPRRSNRGRIDTADRWVALVASGVGPGSRDTDLHRSILRAGWQMRRDHGVVDPLALAQAVRERNPDCGWSDAELDRRCENVLAEIDRVSDEMTRVSFEWDESVSLSDRLTVVLSDSLRRPITVDWLAWRCGLTRHPTSVSGRARAAVRLELRGLCGPGGPFARVRKGSPGVGSVYERRETIAV